MVPWKKTTFNKKSAFFALFLVIQERQVLREKLSDLLSEKIRQIMEIMDKPDYTPKLQNQSQIDTIYDTEFKDIQPYLFRVIKSQTLFMPLCIANCNNFWLHWKVYFSLDGAINQQSMGTAMKRMLKDALSFS